MASSGGLTGLFAKKKKSTAKAKTTTTVEGAEEPKKKSAKEGWAKSADIDEDAVGVTATVQQVGKLLENFEAPKPERPGQDEEAAQSWNDPVAAEASRSLDNRKFPTLGPTPAPSKKAAVSASSGREDCNNQFAGLEQDDEDEEKKSAEELEKKQREEEKKARKLAARKEWEEQMALAEKQAKEAAEQAERDKENQFQKQAIDKAARAKYEGRRKKPTKLLPKEERLGKKVDEEKINAQLFGSKKSNVVVVDDPSKLP
mmetsp:Transcript_36832/g.80498  ORF Transcript_36832/g.80498 Transcript_36832/m.80498 type:complete len:258 (-) Transcript_36832:118-891(-)